MPNPLPSQSAQLCLRHHHPSAFQPAFPSVAKMASRAGQPGTFQAAFLTGELSAFTPRQTYRDFRLATGRRELAAQRASNRERIAAIRAADF